MDTKKLNTILRNYEAGAVDANETRHLLVDQLLRADPEDVIEMIDGWLVAHGE